MKNSILVLTLVLMLVFSISLTGCGNGGEEAAEGEESAEGGEIVLGFIGPLTGDYSIYGETSREGIDLALEEINADGGVLGKTLVLKPYDTKGDKTEAVNAYNRLRDNDGMVAFLGGTISGETLAIKELAVADGMPVLSPTATHLDITPNAANVFRACFTDPYQGETAAVFSAENLGAQTAAIMYNTTDAYSEGLATSFEAKFKEYGEVTTVEGYTQADADFRTLLTKIAATNPDVLYLPDYYAKAGQILSQVEELGLDMPVIGPDGYDGIEDDYADVAEGVYFTNHFAKTDESDIVQNFITNYTEKWDKSPTALAALGYDAAYIMSAAIEKAGSTDSDAIVAALAETEIDGVTGNIVFDENGDPKKSISIIQLIDGELTLSDKVSVK